MTTRWSDTPAYRDLMRNADDWLTLGDWLLDWQLGCAYAAGRRSVIESEEMAVLRRCADVALDEEWNWPKSSTDDAAIRAALEVLKP